jgi:predicted transcriptional regulator
MGQTTVRITETTRDALRELAHHEDEPMQAVLERAVEEYRRKRFIERVNDGYAALRADPKAWKEHQADLQLLDRTAADGLARENWTDDGRALPTPVKAARRKK